MSDKWTMPDWMKPYSRLISACGILYIEEVMNDKSPVQSDTPRALMGVEVVGKVHLVTRLHKEGLLGTYNPERIY